MTEWWSGHAVGLDFETDGPEPGDARIITASVVNVIPGTEPGVINWLVQPERDIPQEAIDVHHVTTERARAEGIPRGDAVADIATMLSACSSSVPLVGHNVGSYDLTVLDREMRRLGLGSLGLTDGLVALRRDGRELARFPVIDTMVLDKALDPYRPGKGGRKLEAVAKQYGVPMDEGAAHAADADTLASLRIAWVIAKRCETATGDDIAATRFLALYEGRKRPREIMQSFAQVKHMTLAELHAAQIIWSMDQIEGLRQYFGKNPRLGVDPKDVTGGWPFQPYV